MPTDIDKALLLQDEFLGLPDPIREWIASSQVGDIIEDIYENAGIYSIARRIVIPTTIFRLVVKDIDSLSVVKILASELKIDENEAKLLAEEIATRVLLPIKQSLFKLGIDIVKIVRGSGNAVPAGTVSDVSFTPGASMPYNQLAHQAPPPSVPPTPVLDVALKTIDLSKTPEEKPPIIPPKVTTLPPREEKINVSSLPTLRAEGDVIKLREEFRRPYPSGTTSANPSSAPTPQGNVISDKPFMLHEQEKFKPIETVKTFRSNVEANYPHKVPIPTIPIQVEFGDIQKSESQNRGAAFVPPMPARYKQPQLASPPQPSLPKVPDAQPPMAPANAARAISDGYRKSVPTPELSKPKITLPVPPPAKITPNPSPKVEGNTLDLRAHE